MRKYRHENPKLVKCEPCKSKGLVKYGHFSNTQCPSQQPLLKNKPKRYQESLPPTGQTRTPPKKTFDRAHSLISKKTTSQFYSLKILHSHYFSETYPAEWEAMQKSFNEEDLLTETENIPKGCIVLPRYRTVPFGDLLENEIKSKGSKLINTYEQSVNVRNLFYWVPLLGDMTAEAHTIEQFEGVPEGKFFIKGQTSSLKSRGPESVFAQSKKDALRMAREMQNDPLLAGEQIAIRPLQHYRQLGTTRKGLPVFNERRVFAYKKEVLAEGFYWSMAYTQESGSIPKTTNNYWGAVREALNRVGHVTGFLVIDMVQYADGRWGVVELNDGCQAGVCGNSENILYQNLKNVFNKTKTLS